MVFDTCLRPTGATTTHPTGLPSDTHHASQPLPFPRFAEEAQVIFNPAFSLFVSTVALLLGRGIAGNRRFLEMPDYCPECFALIAFGPQDVPSSAIVDLLSNGGLTTGGVYGHGCPL